MRREHNKVGARFDADVRRLSHYGFRPLDMPTLFGGLSA